MIFGNTHRIVIAVVAGACLSTGLTGCLVAAAGAGAAAGVGTYAYVTGKLSATLDAPLDRAHSASVKAVESLKFSEASKALDAFNGFVTARAADGAEVKINLKRLTDTTTEVEIRVGTFGDKNRSVAIYEEIKKHL